MNSSRVRTILCVGAGSRPTLTPGTTNAGPVSIKGSMEPFGRITRPTITQSNVVGRTEAEKHKKE